MTTKRENSPYRTRVCVQARHNPHIRAAPVCVSGLRLAVIYYTQSQNAVPLNACGDNAVGVIDEEISVELELCGL